MRLNYVNDDALDQLKKATEHNVERYKQDQQWLSDFFGGEQYRLPSSIMIAADHLDFVMPDVTNAYEVENSIMLFTALRDLKPLQAADERLWAHLCHVECWDYMRRRWPVERNEDTPVRTITERYFFQTNRGRAIVRNGLARLWWYAWMSRDEEQSDPFELTHVLLRRHDDAQSLLERTYPHNRQILLGILRALRTRGNYDRDTLRSLLKSLSRLGGVSVLDSLTPDEVYTLVSNKLDEIEKRTAVLV